MIFSIKFLTVQNIQWQQNKAHLIRLKIPLLQGPGRYNVTTKNIPSSAKYTMRAKQIDRNLEITLGPGNYNIRNEKELQVPSYKIGHDKKRGLEYDNARYVPGPGTQIFCTKNIPNFLLEKKQEAIKRI